MADVRKQVLGLRRAVAFIPRARLASSPYVLRKVFAADPAILGVVAAGEAALPFIEAALKDAKALDEISLAALAFVVERVRPEAAAALLGPLFRKAVDRPGPFFVHFAAHALRRGLGMSLKAPEPVYSQAELAETRAMLR
jgi:hypothetical protein